MAGDQISALDQWLNSIGREDPEERLLYGIRSAIREQQQLVLSPELLDGWHLERGEFEVALHDVCGALQARRQLRETMERERADGAVCILPRECQNERMLFEEVHANILAVDGTRTTILMALPHEGAIQIAVRAAREVL